MASYRSVDAALKAAEQADITTEEGSRKAQEALEWADSRAGTAAERRRVDAMRAKVADAAIEEATADWGDALQVIPDYFRESWRNNKDAAEAVLGAVRRVNSFLTGGEEGRERRAGNREAMTREAVGLVDQRREMGDTARESAVRAANVEVMTAIWPFLNEQQRAEAQERAGREKIGPDFARNSRRDQVQRASLPDEQRYWARAGGVSGGVVAGSDRDVRQQYDDLVREMVMGGMDIDEARSGARGMALSQLVAGGMSPEDASALVDSWGGVELEPFIGVDDDHTQPGDAQDRAEFARRQFSGVPSGASPDRTPRYREGDENAPKGWSSEAIARLQRRMVAAGLITEGSIRYGWFDQQTQAAYRELLYHSNQRAQDQWATLGQMRQEHHDDRAARKAEAMAMFSPTQLPQANTDAMRNRARDALLRIGRRSADIKDSELDEMVKVMSGEYERERQFRHTVERRTFEADVEREFAMPGEQVPGPDFSDLEEPDPEATFEEWFQDGYGGEMRTRERSEGVARSQATLRQGMEGMRAMIRQGG